MFPEKEGRWMFVGLAPMLLLHMLEKEDTGSWKNNLEIL